MSRISPKVIDVDGNRIGDYVETRKPTTDTTNLIRLNGSKIIMNYCKEGRFPTQLFTNIKNDKYKYVKQITNEK